MGEIYKKWSLYGNVSHQQQAFASELKIPEPLISIFIQRGLTSSNEIASFLYPKLGSLPSPETLLGMEEAVTLICHARESRRKVVIFGDYDVDGTTSTSLLVNFFNKIDIATSYVHPDRLKDGYSLNDNLVRTISEKNPEALLVTVDCGISDYDSVQLAKELGLDVIITDHHLPPEILPKADAIINPLQPGCPFIHKNLAGVGLAFYLLAGVRTRLREKGVWTTDTQPNLKEELDLVAIGSVADMVPLRDTNRILVKNGLELINTKDCKREGILALLDVCHLTNKEINSDDIGYQIGPRINAAGRLENAGLATDLFLASSKQEATEMGHSLDTLNEKRKKMAKELTDKAIVQAQKRIEKGDVALVLHGDNWHHGLLGIVASRLTEEFNRPTVILGGTPIAKGSGRTIPSVNLYDALKDCRENLVQFGGHKQAAGLSIECGKIDKFRDDFNKLVGLQYQDKDESELLVDATLSSSTPATGFYKMYKLLEPFGVGNPEPKFIMDKPCCLRNVASIGKGKNHLKFSVEIFGSWVKGIGFGFGKLAEAVRDNEVNIAFSLRDNWFKGNRSTQVYLHDLTVM